MNGTDTGHYVHVDEPLQRAMTQYLYPNERAVEEARAKVRPTTGIARKVLPFNPALFPKSSKPGRGFCSTSNCFNCAMFTLAGPAGAGWFVPCQLRHACSRVGVRLTRLDYLWLFGWLLGTVAGIIIGNWLTRP